MANVYETKFNLTAPVIDMESAIKYLTEDDMTQYLHNWSDIECAKEVVRIAWNLETEQSGTISLFTSRELSEDELLQISGWVSGQNSDGLGEGFEQQDFAYYYVGDDRYEYDDYGYDDEDWAMASFDWETNDYIFRKVA